MPRRVPPPWSIATRRQIRGSGVCTLVKQPFVMFYRRKFLIAVLTCGYYARRSSAANDGIVGVAVRAAEALT